MNPLPYEGVKNASRKTPAVLLSVSVLVAGCGGLVDEDPDTLDAPDPILGPEHAAVPRRAHKSDPVNALARVPVVPFTDSFPSSDGSACNTPAKIYGREPLQDGHYPLYIHLVGTGDDPKNAYALGMLKAMASRGYVAASVDYGTWTGLGWLLIGGDLCPVAHNKAHCAFASGRDTAITKLCARAKADCERGIVVSGHSQGAAIALLAKQHEPRVRAAYALGLGYRPEIHILGWTSNISFQSCLVDPGRALPNEALRIVNGEAENAFGTDVAQQMREIAGIDCPEGTADCLRANGSGWVIFPNSANEDGRGLSQHCYVANMPAGDCTEATGLNSNWSRGNAAYSREANLDWLGTFIDPW